jgi:tRNA1(Val) A37 N6-methylase TrmN6
MIAMSLDHDGNIVKHQTPTRDAFLGGRLVIAQPAKGFRAGLDSVLLGASVRRGEGALLDLGAGVGTAALVALRHAPALTATLADDDPESLALATENVAANGFADRATALHLDIAAPAAARRAAGLAANAYAMVIANPPFFGAGQGTVSPDNRRAAARHMPAAALDHWVRVAVTAATADGEIVFVVPAANLGAILAAFEPRLGAITILPLAPRPGEPANRILIRGVKQSRAPLSLLATRPIHGPEGHGFAPEIEAVLRGQGRFDWKKP